MKEFTTLYLANYGKAANLIQGSCGWGTENSSLDKTGYRKYSYRKPTRESNGTWSRVRCGTFTLCAKSKPADQPPCNN